MLTPCWDKETNKINKIIKQTSKLKEMSVSDQQTF